MRENDVDGVIINVNSIFGHSTAPKFPLSVYGASKFAVTALTKILKNELTNIQSRIKVTVSTQYVKEPFWKITQVESELHSIKNYAR